jgi:ABC-type multidrug transport system fused ATPase/permease subunit
MLTARAVPERRSAGNAARPRRQVGTFLQHTATFCAGFVVAFTRGWDMTLVLVGCLPFLAAVGAILSRMTTRLTNKATAAYTEVRSGACAHTCASFCCCANKHTRATHTTHAGGAARAHAHRPARSCSRA